MKKLILLAISTGLFSPKAYADWDSALEARDAAACKAGQQHWSGVVKYIYKIKYAKWL